MDAEKVMVEIPYSRDGGNTMNRRNFITATAAAVATTATYTLPSLAQNPTPTPEGKQYELNYEGQIVKAVRDFETGSLRLDGAMQFGTIVAIFDTDEHAKKGFEEAAKIIDFIAKENKLEVLERDKLSAPRIGKDRAAESFKVEIESTKFTMTLLRAYEGRVLHVWSAVGFADPSVELLELAEEHMEFGKVDAKKDDAVLDLLPELDEMPSGFKVAEEEVIRD